MKPRQDLKPRSLMRCAVAWLAVACLLSAVGPAFAHHSFGAEYDRNKPVTLTGVITMIQWTNPHFYFFMDVKDKNGEVANWKFEGYPPEEGRSIRTSSCRPRN